MSPQTPRSFRGFCNPAAARSLKLPLRTTILPRPQIPPTPRSRPSRRPCRFLLRLALFAASLYLQLTRAPRTRPLAKSERLVLRGAHVASHAHVVREQRVLAPISLDRRAASTSGTSRKRWWALGEGADERRRVGVYAAGGAESFGDELGAGWTPRTQSHLSRHQRPPPSLHTRDSYRGSSTCPPRPSACIAWHSRARWRARILGCGLALARLRALLEYSWTASPFVASACSSSPTVHCPRRRFSSSCTRPPPSPRFKPTRLPHPGPACPARVGGRPVLLLGIWLGLDGVNPVYYETIKRLYTFPRG